MESLQIWRGVIQVSRLGSENSETSSATELPGYKNSHEKRFQFFLVPIRSKKNGFQRTIQKASFQKEVITNRSQHKCMLKIYKEIYVHCI